MAGRVLLMPRAKTARGKVRGAQPRIPAKGTPPETPAAFPFAFILQNGPRRQGFAAPRFRAPLTARGRSAECTKTRERRLSETRCSPTSTASRWSAPVSLKSNKQRSLAGGRSAPAVQAHSSIRKCYEPGSAVQA